MRAESDELPTFHNYYHISTARRLAVVIALILCPTYSGRASLFTLGTFAALGCSVHLTLSTFASGYIHVVKVLFFVVFVDAVGTTPQPGKITNYKTLL